MVSPAATTNSSSTQLEPGTSGNFTLTVASTTGFTSPTATTASNTIVLAATVQLNGGQNANAATLNVVAGGLTAAFPASGAIVIQTTIGLQTITYTSITANTSFNGCAGGGAGTTTNPCAATAAVVLLASAQNANSATLNVAAGGSTANFPAVGSIIIQTSTGPQTISYTSITANTSFNGCTGGGSGTTTSPCLATLYSFTLNVASTTGFPSTGTALVVATSTGQQALTYTGTTGTSFTGCTGAAGSFSTGGTLLSGNAVTNPQYLHVMNSAGALQIVQYTKVGSGTTFTGCSGGTGTVVANAAAVQAYATTTTSAYTLPVGGAGTITVNSAASFPSVPGLVWVQNSNGTWQAIYYTASSIAPTNELTGCTGGVGTIASGTPVVLGLQTFGSSTATQKLTSGGTLTVASTVAFPSALPLTGSAGSLGLLTDAGLEVVSYSAVASGTTFTVSAATVGTLPKNGVVIGLFNGYGSGGLQTQTIPAVVQNYSHLRSLPVPAQNTAVHVLGANAPGDGGEGIFLWDENSPSGYLNDNVGIVLHSFVSTAGVWRRQGFGLATSIANSNPLSYTTALEINARWFGAVGDGVTDDSTALNAAMAAALQIQVEQNSLPSTLSEAQGAIGHVVVVIPTGRYSLHSTVVAEYNDIRGEGAMLQSSNAIPLLRIGCVHQTIEGITFVGGLNSVALFGPAPEGGYLNPTAGGNVPTRIRNCKFIYPTGPAIWQDTSPNQALTSANNGQTFPFPVGGITLHMTDTSGIILGSPNCVVTDSAGATHTVHYTGHSGTTLTGATCSDTTTATLVTGSLVSLAAQNRPFESQLVVTEFLFLGPHLFWGSGDVVLFANGEVGFDFTSPVVSWDGLPLGLINSSDVIFLSDVQADGAGTSGPRQAVFVGVGLMQISNTSWGQNSNLVFVRARALANTYQGATQVPVPLPVSGYPLNLQISNADLGLCDTAFWLEIYEQWPSGIRLANMPINSLFDGGTLGIWVDAGVATSNLLTQGSQLAVVDIERPTNNVDRIVQGIDPGPYTQPSASIGVVISEVTAAYNPHLDKNQVTVSPNILQSTGGSGFSIAGGSAGPANTQTGMSIATQNGAGTASSGTFTIASANFLPSGAARGIYTFSYYIVTNFAGQIQAYIGPSVGSTGTNTKTRFTASAEPQRIEVQFYYPGGNAPFEVACYVLEIPAQITAWRVGAYLAGNQVTSGGSVYLCIVGGTSISGPSGTSSSQYYAEFPGPVVWAYVGPGAQLTPNMGIGLMMLNAGRRASPYLAAENNDNSSSFGFVPRNYYGTSVPTTGVYAVGDVVWNTLPTAGGVIGWVYTAPGWKSFGAISS